jgi:hypothetical protein
MAKNLTAETKAQYHLQYIKILDSQTNTNMRAIDVLMDGATNRFANVVACIEHYGYSNGSRDANEFILQVAKHLQNGMNTANAYDRNRDRIVDGTRTSALEYASKEAYTYIGNHAKAYFPNVNIDAPYGGAAAQYEKTPPKKASAPSRSSRSGGGVPAAGAGISNGGSRSGGGYPVQPSTSNHRDAGDAFHDIKKLAEAGGLWNAHSYPSQVFLSAEAFAQGNKERMVAKMDEFISNWKQADKAPENPTAHDGAMQIHEYNAAYEKTFPVANTGGVAGKRGRGK